MNTIESQNVTDYPNSNTIFMVWKLNDSPELKEVFQELCALVLNLNNSVFNCFRQQSKLCHGNWCRCMEKTETSDTNAQRISQF